MKIDAADFLDEQGDFYQWKSDSFIQFALVELAGPRRIRFVDEFVYFYWQAGKAPSKAKNPARLAAKMLTPYCQLPSLDDVPTRLSNYTVPPHIVTQYHQALN